MPCVLRARILYQLLAERKFKQKFKGWQSYDKSLIRQHSEEQCEKRVKYRPVLCLNCRYPVALILAVCIHLGKLIHDYNSSCSLHFCFSRAHNLADHNFANHNSAASLFASNEETITTKTSKYEQVKPRKQDTKWRKAFSRQSHWSAIVANTMALNFGRIN